MKLKQVDCFKVQMFLFLFLGIYPHQVNRCYRKYSAIFIFIFLILYNGLCTLNFYFVPKYLDQIIGDMIFYFTQLSVISKALTFFFLWENIGKILNTLEEDMFQPNTVKGFQIIEAAKKFNIRYWKIVAIVSYTSNFTHVLSPLIVHLFLSVPLEFPVCSYSFLSESLADTLKYPIYLYQTIGMHIMMLYNLNIDTFFLGLMIFVIAQLEILKEKLVNITLLANPESSTDGNDVDSSQKEKILKLNKAIVHYDEVGRFCGLIEETFAKTLFVQFSMASCIICVCLFRFTLPAPFQYFIFLATYMFVMIIQILVPCWFGTRIIDTSSSLSHAIYCSNWIYTNSRFKRNMRLFVERANRPLSIIGWKMFPLSLSTFTSVRRRRYGLTANDRVEVV